MEIKLRQYYLEAENTANEEQHHEDQAHITESSNLLFVGEVLRLHRSQKNNTQYAAESSLEEHHSLDSRGSCGHTWILSCEVINNRPNTGKNLCEP